MSKLFFIHIPKTAGSSVNAVMMEWFGRDKSHTHLESHGPWRSRTFDLGQYSFLSGHIMWPAQRARLSSEWQTLVFLRRPDIQLASHLAWVRRLAEAREVSRLNRQPQKIRQIVEQLTSINFSDPAQLSGLVHWLETHEAFLFHNTQTQYMSGVARPDLTALRTALVNLGTVTHIGITERVDEAMCMLANRMGKHIQNGSTPIENAHPQTYGLNISDPATLKALTPLICYDWILYDRARELFIQRLHSWLAEMEYRMPETYSTVNIKLIAEKLHRS